MDVREYIASGILEQFVLDQLGPADREEVLAMARLHPEVREELDAIEAALEQYAEAGKQQLPGDLLADIHTAIDEAESGESPATEGKVVSMQPARSGQSKWLRIAAVFLGLSLIGNLAQMQFWQQEKQKRSAVERELSDLRNDNNRIAEELDAYRASYSQTNLQIADLTNTGSKVVPLACVNKVDNSSATIYWNEESGEVFLSVQSLPDPGEDYQYQLWALKDGNPIDAGVFNLDTGLLRMKEIAAADAFAITLETAGGNPTPNLEALAVIGQI